MIKNLHSKNQTIYEQKFTFLFSATTPNIKDITPKVATVRDIILTDTAIDPKINVTSHLQGTKEFSERIHKGKLQPPQ